MSDPLVYLFPFEKVPQNTKVILYGAGRVGQSFLQQIEMTGYCQVVAVADRSYDQYAGFSVPLVCPDSIPDLIFDVIIVSIDGERRVSEVRNWLINEYHIQETRIVSGAGRRLDLCNNKELVLGNVVETALASDVAPFSLAFSLLGGIGDCIIAKKFIIALLAATDIPFMIDLYGTVHNVASIRLFFSDCNFVNHIFVGNNLYLSAVTRYDVSFKIAAFAMIDFCNFEKIQTYDLVFTKKIKAMQQFITDYGLNVDKLTDMSIHYARCKFRQKNCYTFFAYDGLFDITDQKVTIPLSSQGKVQYDRLNISEPYITVNYGWGSNLGGDSRVPNKVWPLERFEEFIRMFRKMFPSIEIVQIGQKNTTPLSDVNKRVFGEELSTIAYVLKNSLLHVDCEGGMVHLATQLDTMCAVVFGPTSAQVFGYPQNINISDNVCSECYGVQDDFSRCLRPQEDKICMYSITADMVLERITPYITETLEKG